MFIERTKAPVLLWWYRCWQGDWNRKVIGGNGKIYRLWLAFTFLLRDLQYPTTLERLFSIVAVFLVHKIQIKLAHNSPQPKLDQKRLPRMEEKQMSMHKSPKYFQGTRLKAPLSCSMPGSPLGATITAGVPNPLATHLQTEPQEQDKREVTTLHQHEDRALLSPKAAFQDSRMELQHQLHQWEHAARGCSGHPMP